MIVKAAHRLDARALAILTGSLIVPKKNSVNFMGGPREKGLGGNSAAGAGLPNTKCRLGGEPIDIQDGLSTQMIISPR